MPQVIHGDALDEMKRLPDGSFGLVVTSPPYNLLNTTGWGFNENSISKSLLNGYSDHDDAMPYDEYVAWQRACLAEMMRLLRDDGAIFYNHKWRVQNKLIQDRSDIVQGFPVRQIIIWSRPSGINFSDDFFLPTYEVIYLICKPDFRLAPKANALGDVWRIPPARNNDHPAPFPLTLAQRCVASVGRGPVLDPFCGSGTTLVAAELEGLEYLGIDNSAEYVDMARERLAHAKTRMF